MRTSTDHPDTPRDVDPRASRRRVAVGSSARYLTRGRERLERVVRGR